MEELSVMDMLEPREDLEKDALHTVRVHGFVVTRFHQLIQIAVHVLHRNVKPAAVRVQENVQCWNQVRMWG